MRGSSFALRACLILAVTAGAAGLSSCGGGGASRTGIATPSSASRSAQTVITPPGNRAPQSVGTIPAQSLTTAENAATIDLAPYFQDPDNERLTYVAVSNRSDTITAYMSGSTMILNPVSPGMATITVTASDGNANAMQTVAATVAEPENAQTEEQGTDPGQTKTTEPENAQTEEQGTDPGQTKTTEPENAQTEEQGTDPGQTKTTEPENAQTEEQGTDPGQTKTTEPENAQTEEQGTDPGQTKTTEPENAQTEEQGTDTGQTKTTEPENALTGIGVLAQDSQGRETYMRVRMEPAGAQWARINFEIEPYDAGNMCCYQSFADDVYVKFTCAGGYSGGATVKIIVDDHYGHRFEKPISFTCR